MALLGSSFGGDVGLRLLLSPATSNVILRTTCVAVGVGFPVYSTFKAIERKNQNEQEQWLVYWAVYGCFSVVEIFPDKLLSWFPYYYHVKLVFLFWLQLPITSGARHCFVKYLRPFFLKHERKLDWIVDGVRNEMTKFVLSHQQEIHLLKATFHRLVHQGTGNSQLNMPEESISNPVDTDESSNPSGLSGTITNTEGQSPHNGAE